VAASRPAPRLDAVNRPFWTGGQTGKLLICHCGDCGGWIHPPQPLCRVCLSENVAPQAVPGTGVVATFTVNHQAWGPGMETPYVIARVALDGAPGVILTTNIVGSPVDAVEFGDPVRVVFEQHEDVWVPLFEKAG
jgi:uncharacterized OB-fold protein